MMQGPCGLPPVSVSKSGQPAVDRRGDYRTVPVLGERVRLREFFERKGSDVSSRKPADATTSEDDPEAAVACGTKVPDPCLRQRFHPREAHAVEPKQRLICRYPESPIFRLGQVIDATERNIAAAPLCVNQVSDFVVRIERQQRRREEEREDKRL